MLAANAKEQGKQRPAAPNPFDAEAEHNEHQRQTDHIFIVIVHLGEHARREKEKERGGAAEASAVKQLPCERIERDHAEEAEAVDVVMPDKDDLPRGQAVAPQHVKAQRIERRNPVVAVDRGCDAVFRVARVGVRQGLRSAEAEDILAHVGVQDGLLLLFVKGHAIARRGKEAEKKQHRKKQRRPHPPQPRQACGFVPMLYHPVSSRKIFRLIQYSMFSRFGTMRLFLQGRAPFVSAASPVSFLVCF